MSITSAILNKFGYAKTRSTLSNPAQWFIDWVHGGALTSSGLNVNEKSAMQYTPFWSAVRIISSTLAELPFIVYRRLPNGGKDRKQDHKIYELLHERPNPYMDALTFAETRQAHVLTYGNGYAEIQRDGAGRPVALWPLLPNRVRRQIKDDVLSYKVELKTGGSVILDDFNVLHIKGLGFDGYTGYNIVEYHKEAIAYGVAVKQYGSRFFGNNAAPGGVLEHPKSLTDAAAKHLKESWNAEHTGLDQAHRMAILEEGMQYKQMGVDPKQAQSLEVQKYTVDDCSRIFQIPPHMLGSMDRATFNNIEEQNLKFLTMTMLYWFRKWELECNYKLFMPSEKGKLFAEILYDALLRGDIQKRYAAYNVGRTGGWLCVNDIREKENMNPLPDGKGKIYLEPLNMKAAGSPDPKDDSGAGVNDDDVRASLHAVIASQWSRIITKQIKASRNKDDFWPGHHKWASSLLFDSVRAWAAVSGISPDDAKSALDNFINANLKKDIRLYVPDAENLATLTMQSIGVNHV